ncbi:MAG: hypothetical protein P4L99_23100 [Chthoniobacter sp.]|nr:hypothetical protein [Chthoniobacter sp.]
MMGKGRFFDISRWGRFGAIELQQDASRREEVEQAAAFDCAILIQSKTNALEPNRSWSKRKFFVERDHDGRGVDPLDASGWHQDGWPANDLEL